MKIDLKRITALFVLAAMVCTGSCGAGGPRSDTSDTGTVTSESVMTDETEVTAAITFGNNEDVDKAAADIRIDKPINKENMKKLVFLSSWENEENSAVFSIFRENYGIPEKGDPRYGQDKDRIIIVKKVAYDELFDSLSIQVLSDQSPDMFEFTTKMFPYIAANGMVQPIDDVVDMSDPVWDGYRELSEMIKYNGKMYCPVIQYRVEDLWYYRKSVVKEAGLPDPAELFRKGEWDWDHMLSMASAFQQTSTSDQKKYFVDGDYVQSSIMNSSGVPMIGLDDSGKAVNNMNDPRLESAARVLRELCEHDYRYPFEANGNRTNMKEWIMGNTLFFVHGDWFWEDINNQGISFQFTRGRLEPEDIGCVPAPKNPEVKDHPCNYDLFGYAFCAGSENYDSYNAWNQCNMIAHKDKKINEEDKKQRFENYQWTEEVWHMIWEEFEDPVASTLTPVFDFAYGISEDGVHDTTGLTPMDMIMKKPYIDMKYSPYEVARDENNNIINTYIEKINSGITQ